MRPWAHWTAKTALVAAGFAAAGGGLSGVAWAGTASSSPGAMAVLGGNGLLAPVSLPVAACGNAGALLGIAAAGCQGGALASVDMSQGGDGSGTSATVSLGSGNQVTVPVSLCGNAAAVLGASSAGCAGGAGAATNSGGAAGGDTAGRRGGTVRQSGATTGPVPSALRGMAPLAGLTPLSGLTPPSGVTDSSGQTAIGPVGQTFSDTLNAPSPGAGTDTPSASQLVGLGTLPGLADLPSLAGLADLPVRSGVTGGSVLMPGSALSAADSSGMSSNSFAVLAIGALLAGAAALKIASRRARDRKAGIGATI